MSRIIAGAPIRAAREARAVFLILFVAAAYFHQGGGWNQNVRFDQIRAVAEHGTFEIDDYILYLLERDEQGAIRHERVALSDPTTRLARLPVDNGLDLSSRAGRFYPAKPPGTTFLGAPVYFLVYRLERALGVDPDDEWALGLNLYLTTLLTVGLFGAFGGVLLLRVARRLFPAVSPAARVAAALTMGLGTLWLPYSTLLFDHVPVAALSLAALALIRASDGAGPSEGRRAAYGLLAAGGACGLMLALNYGVVLTAALLFGYALWLCRPRVRALWLAAGAAGPVLALAGYHQVCFGDPLSIAYEYELDVFKTRDAALLSVFDWPDPAVLRELLIGPHRGLLVTSPVLALSAFGIYRMLRSADARPEGILIAGVAVAYLLQVSAFNGWHGGSAIGPRYLMPAIPFLAIALVPAFDRLPHLTGLLAAASAAVMTMVTAVNPQVDVDIHSPIVEYYLPLASGRTLELPDRPLIRGPVSVNAMGVAGGELELFYPRTRYARWNSFNLGEPLLGSSWLSLVPLLAAWGLLGAALVRGPRR